MVPLLLMLPANVWISVLRWLAPMNIPALVAPLPVVIPPLLVIPPVTVAPCSIRIPDLAALMMPSLLTAPVTVLLLIVMPMLIGDPPLAVMTPVLVLVTLPE